jgi:large subunit ribosomal protein L33
MTVAHSVYVCYLCAPVEKKHIAMAKKGNRVQVILECTEQKETNVPGTSRYITTKNRKNTPARIERKKYNPNLKRVTLHKEIK